MSQWILNVRDGCRISVRTVLAKLYTTVSNFYKSAHENKIFLAWKGGFNSPPSCSPHPLWTPSGSVPECKGQRERSISSIYRFYLFSFQTEWCHSNDFLKPHMFSTIYYTYKIFYNQKHNSLKVDTWATLVATWATLKKNYSPTTTTLFESAEGWEWPYKIFNDQISTKECCRPSWGWTCNLLITSWTPIQLSHWGNSVTKKFWCIFYINLIRISVLILKSFTK